PTPWSCRCPPKPRQSGSRRATPESDGVRLRRMLRESTASRHAPNLSERFQPFVAAVLETRQTQFFIRTADDAVVADVARIFLGSRWQESARHRIVDVAQQPRQKLARLLGQRNLHVLETAALGRVK